MHELEESLAAFEKKRKDLEQNITGLRSKKAELEGEIIKTEKSLHLDSSDLILSEKKHEELKEGQKSVEKSVNEVQDTILEKNRSLAKLKTEKMQHRSKIAELRDPSLIAELSTYEEKSRQLHEEIVKMDSELKNIEIQLKDIFSPEIEKTKSILKQIEKEQIAFKKEVSELTKELESSKKTLGIKEKEAQAFYAQF